MMLRTYYWHHRIVSKRKLNVRRLLFRDGHKYFTTGNAGDIFVKDIVKHRYGLTPLNADSGGKRLLLVGSISHRVQDGDVLCGIGTQGKADSLPERNNVTIIGLRGPISYDEFYRKGYDMSKVRFLLDPGLLARFMYFDESIRPEAGNVCVIPHYKERARYRNYSKHVRLIDIDDRPSNVCRKILSAEHVFSSSLHGIIFAHALGRPATLIMPDSESLLKYKDYYASVGLDFPVPLREFNERNMRGLKDSPEHIVYKEEDFSFPSLDVLLERGVVFP